MHDEMKADIDKNGRCTGAYCSAVQLYDAPFSFRVNTFIFFLRFHFLGEHGGAEGSEPDPRYIRSIQNLGVFAELC